MADDRVEIPIDLTVQDIKLNDVDIRDVEKTMQSKLSELSKQISNVFNSIDTSKLNKNLSSSMDKVKSSIQKAETAQRKFNEAVADMGTSSTEYKKIMKQNESMLADFDKKIQAAKDLANGDPTYVSAKAKQSAGTKLNTAEYAKVQFYENHIKQMEMERLQVLKDIDATQRKAAQGQFDSSASEASIRKVVDAYHRYISAVTKANSAAEQWNNQMDNPASNMTDAYNEAEKKVESIAKKMDVLSQKAEKMASVGATDHAWAGLEYDIAAASKEMDNLIEQMRTGLNDESAFRFGYDESAYNKAMQALDAYQKKCKEILKSTTETSHANRSPFTGDYEAKLKELTALENKINSIKEKSSRMAELGATSSAWSRLNYEASLLEGKVIRITDEMREMVNSGAAFKFGGDASAELGNIDSTLERLIKNLREVGKAPRTIRGAIMSALGSINKFIVSVGTGIGSLIGKFAALRKESRRTSSSIGSSLNHALKNIMMFGFVRSLFTLVRTLRNTFVTAFGQMAQQIPAVNTQVSSFMTSLNQLKGSMATAFQPIVSFVLPVLERLIATLVTAMNALARFFATLTGQGFIYKFTAAQVDYAASVGDTGDAAKDAGKKVKEYEKALMGFDEINKLNPKPDEDDSGSGGGGGGGGGAPMLGTWEKEPLEGFSNLAQMIKDAWKDGDFTEVGEYLGEKLLGALKVADEWIVTKGYPLAEKIGKSLGTLINGFVSVDGLADQIGKTVAHAINMGMIGLNTFLKTTDWLNVGKFIADFANSSVNNFNWELLGETVGHLLMAGINTWWKFVTTFDFTQLGQKVADCVNTFLNTMGEVDITGLSGWQKLGQSVSKTITGILEFLITAVKNTNWTAVGQAIGEVLSSIEWSKIVIDFATLVWEIIKGIAQAFISWANTDPISAAIAGIFATAFAGVKIASVISFLGGAIRDVLGFFSAIKDGAKLMYDVVSNAFSGMGTSFGGILGVAGGIALAVVGFFRMISDGFSWADEALMLFGIAIAAVGAVVLGVPAVVAGVVAAIVAVVATLVVFVVQYWDEICQYCSECWEWIKTTFSEGLEAIKEWWTETWESVKQLFSDIWDGITSFFDTLWTGFQDLISRGLEFIQETWETIWEAVSTFFSDTWEAINELVTTVFEGIQKFISDTLEAIQKTWDTVWGAVDKAADTIWKGIDTLISNTISGISKGIGTALGDIKKAWDTAWNGVSRTTKTIWDGISSTIKGTVNAIIGFINKMIQGVVSGINGAISSLNAFKVSAPDWVPGIGGKSFGFNLGKVSAPQIPQLAKGAVIPPNKEFMAVLGDQKSGTNIEAPLSTIQGAVANVMDEQLTAIAAMAEAIVAAIENKNMSVVIGDREIGQAASRYNRRQALVRGTT